MIIELENGPLTGHIHVYPNFDLSFIFIFKTNDTESILNPLYTKQNNLIFIRDTYIGH